MASALEQRAWNSPVRFVATFLSLTWATLFIGHRIIMFKEAWLREWITLQDSEFVVDNICRHDWMRANLGEEYSDVCERAKFNAHLWPAVSAAKYVVKNTHLCGDDTCLEVLRQVVDAIGYTVAVATASALVLLLLATWCIGKTYKRTRQTEELSTTLPLTWRPKQAKLD